MRTFKNNRKTQPTDATQQKARALLGVAFAVFSFCYFYWLEDAALTIEQHQLSHGITHYQPFIGALILTMLMLGIQRLVIRLISFRESGFMLTYFPSAAIAVLLTAFVPMPQPTVIGITIALGIVWIAWAIISTRHWRASWNRDKSGTPWIAHLLILLFLTIYMGMGCNSNDILNYEVKTARDINAGKYGKALEVGRQSLATSSTLTALRMYAMSRGNLNPGERLFAYPMTGAGSRALFITEADSVTTIFCPDSLYALLHMIPPRNIASLPTTLRIAAAQHPTSAAKDYLLCGLLLDKDLKGFVETLPHFYHITDSTNLPRYYEEAIVLYERLYTRLPFTYSDPNTVANYLDFKEKGRALYRTKERRNMLWREYGDTYWWYYFFQPLDNKHNVPWQ